MSARNLHRVAVFLLFAVASTLALLAVIDEKSHADAGGPPIVIGGGTESNPVPNPPGDGSTGNPTPPPNGSVWMTGNIALTPTHYSGHHYEDMGGRLVTIAYHCEPKGKDADWVAVSVWWQIGLNKDTGEATTAPLVGCSWPLEPTDQRVTCAAFAQVTITRERSTAGVVSERLTSVNDTSAWSSDRTNVAKCEASRVEAYTNQQLELLGGYAVDTRTRLVPCVARTYYDGRGPKIVDCGAGKDKTTRTLYGLYCNGSKVRLDKDQSTAYTHDWGWGACTDGGGLIRCNYEGQAPTLDGRISMGGPFEVLDDRTDRTLRYPALSVDGIVGAPTDVRTRLNLGNKISPFRDGESANGARQAFISDRKLDAWQAGDFRKWELAWVAPGVQGKPWTAVKESAFTATVKVATWTIAQVDIYGNVTLTKGSTTMEAQTSCAAEEFSVDVFRARSTSATITH